MNLSRARDAMRRVVRRSPTLAVALTVAGRAPQRSTGVVDRIYSDEWGRYEPALHRAQTLADWLFIAGVDDAVHMVNLDGRLVRDRFDHRRFVVKVLVDTIRREFPDARSVTEFGCGVGRNLLALKNAMRDLEAYGYELTQRGVEIAEASVAKLGIAAQFAQLDYVHDGEEKYVHPVTDVGFTVYSLNEVPRHGDRALRNMLAHVARGLVLFEPAPENFPLTYRGTLGRVYARARDYLHGLDASVAALQVRSVRKTVLTTSNNPVFYPTLYVIEKHGRP